MHGTIHLFERLAQVDGPVLVRPGRPLAAPGPARPLLGLIRNPRSHRNESRRPALVEREGVIVATPVRRRELAGILADFALREVDCIAIDGGDGTVRDVLTCGAGIFGDRWPDLIVLPSGKTNALAHDLGIPTGWTLEAALAAASRGHTLERQTLKVSRQDDPRSQVHGFVLGAGAFTKAIELGQKSHSLGAFDTLVVALTAGWSLAQALLGGASNPWRTGTPMHLRDGQGRAVPHCGGLPEDQRYLLFASTLMRFPAGLDPFRGLGAGLRVGVLDNSSRSLLLRLPRIAAGKASPQTRARGLHIWRADTVELDLGEPFILDGEAFPAGQYRLGAGPTLRFIVP